MPDITSPVAVCAVCLNPLADHPALVREGDAYVHVNCWSGNESADRGTAEVDGPSEQKTQPGQAA